MIPDKSFYVNPKKINDRDFTLDSIESNHLVNVLRLNIGDKIFLLDGLGTAYVSIIEHLSKDGVSGIIEEKFEKYGENKSSINLVPAIIKRDRFENLIEKAVELGVYQIQPLILDHCQKKTINIDRCKKIIISSAKQCKRSFFPVINEPVNLEVFLKHKKGACFVGTQNVPESLMEFVNSTMRYIELIIGPEGDFSKKEYDLLKKNNVQFFNLGQRRLRSETASLAALSILNAHIE